MTDQKNQNVLDRLSRVWVGVPFRVECGLVLQSEWGVGWCSRQSRVWVGAPERAVSIGAPGIAVWVGAPYRA